MTCEIDGFWFGVKIHDEGDDCGGKVSPYIVCDVALAIVAINLSDAIHVRFIVLNIIITRNHFSIQCPLFELECDSILIIL